MDIENNQKLEISKNDIAYEINVNKKSQLSKSEKSISKPSKKLESTEESSKIEIPEKTKKSKIISPYNSQQIITDENEDDEYLSSYQEEESKNKTTENSKQITMPNGVRLKFMLEEKTDETTGNKTKELVVYMLDKETGDIIRKIPPDEYMDLYKDKLTANQLGLFMDVNL